MKDLISREALREDFYELEIHGTMAVKAVLPIIEERIDNLPAVDAVEVVWKPIVGFEGLYEISSLGRVRNKNGKIMKQGIKRTNWNCYKTVALWKDGKCHTKSIHRIVAEAFIPNPENLPLVNHKDEDGTNNFIDNLEWCTSSYNRTYGHAIERQAKQLRGKKHTEEHKSKISDSMKKHYKTHVSKSLGRESEKRKAVKGYGENEVAFFHSVAEAAKAVGGARSNITRSCNHPTKTAYGFKWEWVEDGE